MGGEVHLRFRGGRGMWNDREACLDLCESGCALMTGRSHWMTGRSHWSFGWEGSGD